MRRHLTSKAISALLLIACAGEAPEPGFQVRDSAGVRILENAGSLGPRLLPWKLGEAPLADIGAREGDPSHELFRVRDVLRLPDGRIAVQDGGSNKVRFFSASGRHLGTVGGQGGGPGEYQSVAGLALAGGDSLLAFDDALGRISVSDLQGDFIDSFRLQATGDPIHPLRLYRLEATTEDDGLLMLPAGYPADMKPSPVIHWDSVANLLYAMDGTLRDTVGEFSGMDIYATPNRAGDLLFGRYRSADLYEDELYITDGGKYEIRVYAMTGELQRIVRLERPPRPVTADDESVLREVYMARVRDEEGRQRMEEYLRDWPRAEHKTWLSGLVVDPTGHIWVEEYEPYWVHTPKTWSVIAPDGRWLGSTRLPARFRVMEIGEDYVLGVWRDENDVEHVLLYRLERDS